jgi:hypothetical protein
MKLASLTIPARDKKMIIWNFMGELWRKYKNAKMNGLQAKFDLNDFYNMDVFEKYLPIVGIKESKTDNLILDALQEYEKRGYFKIEAESVMLTESGVKKCQEPYHNWD